VFYFFFISLHHYVLGEICEEAPSLVTVPDTLRALDLYIGPCSEHRIVQELCESRGGCPGLSVLTSLLVSVDVKLY